MTTCKPAQNMGKFDMLLELLCLLGARSYSQQRRLLSRPLDQLALVDNCQPTSGTEMLAKPTERSVSAPMVGITRVAIPARIAANVQLTAIPTEPKLIGGVKGLDWLALESSTKLRGCLGVNLA
ncbi:hypothetical protein BO82DRAFT_431059 [Aspergillus uvarum CBS 121591]|uniref:Uncharacterized protein n=1 Tax=Aspergillus uvarum CBS 121591 TaxID=1448315 RepID=A0A319CHJ7_9EURO|nr:hypothetical protein BO82DRAFT_431059 [Aspergillus uvarum CBS 121591]PYH83331.1 hypothetical protein BO82DRAFT_431059 [Aspergillus uvarum CBS 121591]